MTEYVLFGVIAFLLIERWQFAIRAEKERLRMLGDYQHVLDRSAADHHRECDRLQARSLSEYKSWSEPNGKTEPTKEEVDADWMRPSFAMPEVLDERD